MSIESADDWKGLRRAGRIVQLTLDALDASVRPGVTTAELDAVAARIFAEHGARSAPAMVYGFPGTVLISVNDEVVHGVPGARRLAPGDLVKLDVTLEKDGYVADAARSVIVGTGSDAAMRLATCAREAFEAALTVARAGTKVNAISRAVESTVRARGFTVVRGLTGHGVGRTIHEPPQVPNEYDPWQNDVLTDGLVLTIEPIISAGSARIRQDRDGWTTRTTDGSWAAHHEHTIVITRDRPIVLTAG
ncbi:MAG TPA: type I methionyl aminopeptidase [Vicinamibacterales bacterium]|nr:type I methionyl aminopeptidase [Vicinamibacterales bacterium]